MSVPYRTPRLIPKSLRQCIEPVAKDAFRKRGFAESRLLMEWSNIVGHELGRITAPHAIDHARGEQTGGTLTLHVESAHALEMQHREPEMLERIATYFGYRAVTRIKLIQVSRLSGPPPRPVTFAPLSESSRQSLDALLREVEDAELKQALQSLGNVALAKRPA